MAAKVERLIDIRPSQPDSIWPTAGQLHLLRAALWPGAEGREAWEAWKRTTDVGTIDFGSWNLLPLVWRNLSGQNLVDPLLDECRSYYRYHWARNQVVLRQAAGWVSAWQERGIPVMVLKGAALMVDCYRDAGLRPMGDVDLMVPIDKAQEAAAWLKADGWVKHIHFLEWEDVTLEAQQSYNWQKGDARLDLHWHVDERCTDPKVAREHWARAQPLQLDKVTTRRLCPEDMLLHVCSHGMIWNWGQAPFRWMVDAEYILRRYGSGFDWARVLAMAEQTRSTLAVRHGLEYAATELRLAVPPEVLAGLRNRRYGWWERTDYNHRTSPNKRGRMARILNVLRMLWLTGGGGSPLARWRRISRALRARWGAPSVAQALWCAIRKALTGDRRNWLSNTGANEKP